MSRNDPGPLGHLSSDTDPKIRSSVVALIDRKPFDGFRRVVAGAALALDEPSCLGIDEGLIVTSPGEPGEEHVQPL